MTARMARRSTVVLVAGAAVALTACSNSTTASTAPAAAAKPVAATSAAGISVTPASLIALLRSGVANISGAHIAVTGSLSRQSVTANGDFEASGSTITTADVTATFAGQAVEVLVVNEVVYVKLPAALATGTKPWVKVSAASTNPIAKKIAGLLASAPTAASLDKLAQYVTSVTKVGAEQVAGVAATHYRLIVDASKAPSSSLVPAGDLKAVPVDLWLDGQNRPVQIVAKTTGISGTVKVSKFGEIIAVKAPAASEVD